MTSEAGFRRDWMRRAEEVGGYLLEAFDLFTVLSAQVQDSQWRRGAAQTLPRCLQ